MLPKKPVEITESNLTLYFMQGKVKPYHGGKWDPGIFNGNPSYADWPEPAILQIDGYADYIWGGAKFIIWKHDTWLPVKVVKA